jgi:hypothetical protein
LRLRTRLASSPQCRGHLLPLETPSQKPPAIDLQGLPRRPEPVQPSLCPRHHHRPLQSNPCKNPPCPGGYHAAMSSDHWSFPLTTIGSRDLRAISPALLGIREEGDKCRVISDQNGAERHGQALFAPCPQGYRRGAGSKDEDEKGEWISRCGGRGSRVSRLP